MNGNGRFPGRREEPNAWPAATSSLDYVAAAWVRLPPHVQEAILTVVDGTLHYLDDQAARRRGAALRAAAEALTECTAILWATPGAQRPAVLSAALAFEPTGLVEAWEVGRLRALFAELWEFCTGAPLPAKTFRRMFGATGDDAQDAPWERLSQVDRRDELRMEIVSLVSELKRLVEKQA
jgi:hypothetical protein